MVIPTFFHPHSRRRSAIHAWSSPAAADFRQIFAWRHPTADSNCLSPRFHRAQDCTFFCFEPRSRRQSAMHTARMQPLIFTTISFGNIQVLIPFCFTALLVAIPFVYRSLRPRIVVARTRFVAIVRHVSSIVLGFRKVTRGMHGADK